MPEQIVPELIVLCHCRHRGLLSEDAIRVLSAGLEGASAALVTVPDLCDLVQRDDPLIDRFSGTERVLLCACHERAVRSLFEAAGSPLSESACCVDMRVTASVDVSALLDGLRRGDAGDTSVAEFLPVEAESSDAWFPLIDRTRCVDCGACADFCLFGVYERSASGRVTVASPSSCKTNCPACARICPENAIIFPKSDDEAINGAALDEESLRGARIRLNPEDMLRGDVYSRLKARMSGEYRQLFKPGILEGNPLCPASGHPQSAPNPGRSGEAES